MIKAIIFDFAGVIATEGFMLWLQENIPNFAQEKDTIINLSHKVDKGEITGEEFAEILAKRAGKKSNMIWPEIFEKLIIDTNMIELLKKLKKNYKVALLTNHITEWITEVIDIYKLQIYFDKIMISSQEKVIKPEAEIFLRMLNSLQVKSSEAIFIDDREININGAEKIGIKSILFKNYSQLLEELKNLGVTI